MIILFRTVALYAILGASLLNASPRISAFIAVDARGDYKISGKPNIQLIQNTLKLISLGAGLDLDMVQAGKRPLDTAISSWAKKLKKSDIAIFYFSGRGYRLSSTDGPWPILSLKGTRSTFDANALVSLIKKIKPRLGLILLDCGNNNIDLFSKSESLRSRLQLAKKSIYKGIEKLFKQSKGLIVASATLPGNFSLLSNQGSYFTLAFIHTLFQLAKKRKTSWDEVMLKTKNLYNNIQTAQYEVILK